MQLTKNSPEYRLRNILAVNRGLEFLKEYDKKLNEVADHDQSDRSDYLQNLLSDIHRALFPDMHDPASGALGSATTGEKRGALREAVIALANALFDSNGFVQSDGDASLPSVERKKRYINQLAGHLAEFHRAFQEIDPYAYGNSLTLNLFMDCVGRLLNKKGMDFVSVDFRRLDRADLDILEDPSRNGEIQQVFLHALDAERDSVLQNEPDQYGKLTSGRVLIAGVPFLGYTEGGTEYLVTVNGGLVERQKIEEDLKHKLLDGKTRVMELRYQPTRLINDSKTIKELSEKKLVDGYEITDAGAPLVCMDVNPLTGLRTPSHKSFMNFYQDRYGKKATIFQMKDPEFAQRVIDAAPDDLKHIATLAAGHVRRVTHQLDEITDGIFAGKTLHDDGAEFVMSMGGPGSGKTVAKEIMAAKCGNDYVEASLDKARTYSDIYQVLLAAKHHADDYTTIEPFASTLRSWIKDRALNKKKENHGGHYNILYDGTGIPFEPRYADLIKEFKDEHFHTTVACIDTFLVTPDRREGECSKNVLERVRDRLQFGNDQRNLPPIVVISKHRNVMESLMEAVENPFVDKAVAFCNDGPENAHYLLAETFDDRQRAPEAADSKRTTVASMIGQATSVLSALSTAIGDTVGRLVDRIPMFKEGNTTLINKWVQRPEQQRSGTHRTLAISNVTRFVDMGEKALLNPHASGPENLLHPQRDAAFAVPTYASRAVAVSPMLELQQVRPEYSQGVQQAYEKSRSVSV